MLRSRRRNSNPFTYEPVPSHRLWYRNRNFLRLTLLASVLLVYFVFRSWWTYMPVKSLKKKEFFDALGNRRLPVQDPAVESRFMASIIQRPPALPVAGVKIMDSFLAGKLAEAENLRFITLKNLKFCDMLEGSVVDGLTNVYDFGAIGSKNLNQASVVNLIDSNAAQSFEKIFDYFGQVDSEKESKRLACYSALDGANPLANLSESSLGVRIHPMNYFASTLPTLVPKPNPKKRKFKNAYLIMIQETNGFGQLKELVKILDDTSAIIMIHVDTKDPMLYTFAAEFVEKRKASGTVFLAKNRYKTIPGHVSILYTQLSGYFELLDLADWDYVINLSNYDWPLRHSAAIYQTLNKFPGYSYIDFFADTGYLPPRLFRTHLGDKSKSYNYHPSELSLSAWPFAYWQAYRQSQWMILSRGAVEFLRVDTMALNFLAFVEHAYNPEETFFATVLANSPSQNTKLVQDKKRYAREAGSGVWCGWKDREMFPPGSTDPPFFFFRPFNMYGTLFGEDKLLTWVKENHLDQSVVKPCLVGELGTRDECIRELAADTAINNGLILIPVGSAFLHLVANLRCSLSRQGIKNIVFWSFENAVHQQVMSQGLLSYYDPSYEVKPPPERFHQQDPQFAKIIRHKPTILLKLLNAGFDTWYIDADVVAMRDFRIRALDYIASPFNADIILTVSESKLITPTKSVVKPPSPDSGIMFLRSTEKSKIFLEDIEDRIRESVNLDEEDAFSEAVSQGSGVTWTGIGTKARAIIYPDGKNGGKIEEEQNILESPVHGPDFMNGLVDFFNFYSSKDSSDNVRIHFFDQLEFVNGKIFFRSPDLIPNDYAGHRLIHANEEFNVDKSLRKRNLWFLNDKFICSKDIEVPKE